MVLGQTAGVYLQIHQQRDGVLDGVLAELVGPGLEHLEQPLDQPEPDQLGLHRPAEAQLLQHPEDVLPDLRGGEEGARCR